MGLKVVFMNVGVLLAISSVISSPTSKNSRVFPSEQTAIVVPSQFKLKPRISIPSSYAKSYWVSGTFFNNANFKGLPMSFYFTGPKCINFPSTRKSVKPTGCVLLYKNKNCLGPYVIANDDMAELGMGQINSMKTCPPLDDSWRSQQQVPVVEEVSRPPVTEESVLETPEQESRVEYRTIDFGKNRPSSRYIY